VSWYQAVFGGVSIIALISSQSLQLQYRYSARIRKVNNYMWSVAARFARHKNKGRQGPSWQIGAFLSRLDFFGSGQRRGDWAGSGLRP
jgi:hypothetical protein